MYSLSLTHLCYFCFAPRTFLSIKMCRIFCESKYKGWMLYQTKLHYNNTVLLCLTWSSVSVCVPPSCSASTTTHTSLRERSFVKDFFGKSKTTLWVVIVCTAAEWDLVKPCSPKWVLAGPSQSNISNLKWKKISLM